MSYKGKVENVLDFFNTQRNIFGICPCCTEVFRLSDIKLSYKQKFAKDWFDRLTTKEENILEEKMTIEETLREIRKKEIERVRKRHLPKMLKKVDPIFTPLGYYPQDVKAIFDPLDFVIFDGMNREDDVKNVIFMDEHNTDEQILKTQSSIETVIQKEKYEFQSIRLTKDGEIQS